MGDALADPAVGVLGLEVRGVPGRLCVGDYVLLGTKQHIAVVDLLSFVPAREGRTRQPKRPKGVPAYLATSVVGPGAWYVRGRWVYRPEDLPRQGLVAALGREAHSNEVFPSMDRCVCSVAHVVGRARVQCGCGDQHKHKQDEVKVERGADGGDGKTFVYYNVMMEDGALVPAEDPVASAVVAQGMDVATENTKALEGVPTEPAPTLPQDLIDRWTSAKKQQQEQQEEAQPAEAEAEPTNETRRVGDGDEDDNDEDDEPVGTPSSKPTGKKRRAPEEKAQQQPAPPKNKRRRVEDTKPQTPASTPAKEKRTPPAVMKSADIGVLLAKENGVEQFRWIGRPTRGTEQGPDIIVYGGFEKDNVAYHVGDFYLTTTPESLGLGTDKPCTARVLCCYQRCKDSKCLVVVEWFVMPEAVEAATGAKSMDGEVYPTMAFADVSVADVGSKCRVIHATEVCNVAAWAQKPQHFWWRRWFDTAARAISETTIAGTGNTSPAAEHAQRRVSSVW